MGIRTHAPCLNSVWSPIIAQNVFAGTFGETHLSRPGPFLRSPCRCPKPVPPPPSQPVLGREASHQSLLLDMNLLHGWCLLSRALSVLVIDDALPAPKDMRGHKGICQREGEITSQRLGKHSGPCGPLSSPAATVCAVSMPLVLKHHWAQLGHKSALVGVSAPTRTGWGSGGRRISLLKRVTTSHSHETLD